MSPSIIYNELFWMIGFFVLLFGLCIGSFLNVVALRAFSGESIVLPPSKCPKCKNKLHWYNNIPVLSYIFLGGKCQFCKDKISLQYPIVELSNATLYICAYTAFGATLKTFFICILMSFFLLIIITDFKEKVVFDHHTYPIIALGLLYNICNLGSINIWESLLGIVVGFIFFELVARAGYLVAPTRAFGEGDTIIAMGLGAFFGWKILIIITVAAIFLQAIAALPILFVKAFKKKDSKTCTALGFLVLGLLIVSAFNYFNLYRHFHLTVGMLLFVSVTLLWAMKTILGGMKNKKEEDLLYLPFGPALVLCATVSLYLPLLKLPFILQ